MPGVHNREPHRVTNPPRFPSVRKETEITNNKSRWLTFFLSGDDRLRSRKGRSLLLQLPRTNFLAVEFVLTKLYKYMSQENCLCTQSWCKGWFVGSEVFFELSKKCLQDDSELGDAVVTMSHMLQVYNLVPAERRA